jgi:hypothetical protein
MVGCQMVVKLFMTRFEAKKWRACCCSKLHQTILLKDSSQQTNTPRRLSRSQLAFALESTVLWSRSISVYFRIIEGESHGIDQRPHTIFTYIHIHTWVRTHTHIYKYIYPRRHKTFCFIRVYIYIYKLNISTNRVTITTLKSTFIIR